VTIIHNGLDVNPAGLGTAATDKTETAPGQATAAQTQTQPGSDSPSQQVQITPTAQLLASLEQQLAATPEVDQGRVDSLRQALSNGTYQVDAGRVADGLLAAQKLTAQAAAGSGSAAQAQSLKAFATTAQLGSDSGLKE
jgi:negative regulator of flagellin synthesis FlgM